MGENPRVSTVITDFIVIDCPSAINGIIGRPLLKALRTVTSIYHLTMKFLTVEGMSKYGVANMTQESATISHSN